MSGTLPIVLIVVVWLFVLAPIALRGRKPIRHTNEAFEETRVIHSGGEELPTQRRRPRLTPADVHASEQDEDLEYVEPDDVLIESDDEAPRLSDRIGQTFSRFSMARKVGRDEVVEGTVVPELPEVEKSEAVDELESDVEYDEYSEYEDDTYPYDDAYYSPADYLHADADYEEAEPYEGAMDSDVEDSYEEDELSAADLEFAARRRGRGGYDPEADAEATAQRYQRRRRTLLALVAIAVVSLVVAGFVGGAAWIAPVVAVAVIALYLFALRRQVQQEQALRARRIKHMRRARLGVRSAESEELGLPARLRRPGAVVLELDDDSADFAELPVATATFEHELDETMNPEPRRVS